MGIFLCWLLSLLPAVPMMLPWSDTRTINNDGSGCLCDFPYKSVSRSLLSKLLLYLQTSLSLMMKICKQS